MPKRKKMLQIYKVREAAEYLGICPNYLRMLLRQGKIKGFRIGGTESSHWRILKEELLRFTKR